MNTECWTRQPYRPDTEVSATMLDQKDLLRKSFLLSRYLGWTPYNEEFKLSTMLVAYSSSLSIASFAINSAFFYHEYSKGLRFKVACYSLTIASLTVATSLFDAVSKFSMGPRIRKVLVRLKFVEDSLESMGLQTKSNNVGLLLRTGLKSATTITTYLFLQYESNYIVLLWFCAFTLRFVVDFQIEVLLEIVKGYYITVNERTSELCFDVFGPFKTDSFELLARNHDRLLVISRLLNETYSHHVLTSLCLSFIMFLQSSFACLANTIDSEEVAQIRGFDVSVSFLHLMQIWQIVMAFENTAKEVHNRVFQAQP